MVSPGLVWVAVAVVAAGAALGWFLRGRPAATARRYVANSSYLLTLPSFRRRLLRRRLGAGLLVALVAATTAAAALLVGRPVDRYVEDERMATRDIVLCLDVSGSMIPFDSEVLEVFAEMVPSFRGERIALNIWNATTRVVFPLTDDYALVERELAEGAEILDIDITNPFTSAERFRALERWIAGTVSWSDANSSLIGDGLANCALSFDQADTERSRTIIMATDNQVAGVPIFSLPEAAAFADERGARIHGLYAAGIPDSFARQEYEEVVTSRGGLFHELTDAAAVEGIIADITAQQAVELQSDPKVVEVDRPDRWLGALVALVAMLVLGAWWVRP